MKTIVKTENTEIKYSTLFWDVKTGKNGISMLSLQNDIITYF